MGTMTHRRRALVVLTALALVAAVPVATPSEAVEAFPGCSGVAEHPGGDWPSYGHDLSNTRHQPAEATIGTDNVADLESTWVFETPGGGVYNNTPLVADGCIYLAASDGWVSALNADTAEVVWEEKLDVSPEAFGGGIVGSPAISGDDLLVIVNQEGSPYVTSLSRVDGTENWTTVLDDQPFASTNASVVVHDGLVLAGFSGNAGPGTEERGGFVILDATTGDEIEKTFVITDEEFDQGYAGAGVWSTAAVDTDTGYAYAGTSNPHSSRLEAERANSIIKIDLDPTRGTFGEIVDHYKGRPDTYVEGLADQPVCETAPEVYYIDRFSATCLQIDLDFGASPNLWTDPTTGQTVVGDLQKAGVYHAVDTETMDGLWETIVGVPCLACNAASAAYSNGSVFTAAGPPGQIFSLEDASGLPQWAGHLTGPTSYNSVSSANGVVYTSDSAGTLNAFDAETGVLLVKRNLSDDTGTNMFTATSSSGVTIARNTVYVAHGAFTIAYQPAGDDGGGLPGVPELPGAPEVPELPDAELPARVVAGPGSVATTYTTPVMVMQQGQTLSFTNGDVAPHDIDSPAWGDTPLIGLGESYQVQGTSDLSPGQYGFFCSIHPNMFGTLVVQ